MQVTAITRSENYQTTLKIGKHEILADEPVSLGGQDMGPNPKELLGAALASCTSITMRMYAGRKNWILENLVVDVEISKSPDSGQEYFRKNIRWDDQDWSADQVERILKISKACPVHKMLEQGNIIETIKN